jgi:hypothetical protein
LPECLKNLQNREKAAKTEQLSASVVSIAFNAARTFAINGTNNFRPKKNCSFSIKKIIIGGENWSLHLCILYFGE